MLGCKSRADCLWLPRYVCDCAALDRLLTCHSASVIGVTLGEPSFLVYMGLLDPKTEALTSNANQLIGATSGVFQVRATYGHIPITILTIAGRCILWCPHCQLCHGQMGKKSWHDLLCMLLHRRWSIVSRLCQYFHVHCRSFLRWNGKLGLPCR
jgi:hypothetical protein